MLSLYVLITFFFSVVRWGKVRMCSILQK
uniref:Uncharacterized protein n=1 Tax=Arundo donax TaxID=35708 RepID=A0A0A8Y6Z3_ARUDO